MLCPNKDHTMYKIIYCFSLPNNIYNKVKFSSKPATDQVGQIKCTGPNPRQSIYYNLTSIPALDTVN